MRTLNYVSEREVNTRRGSIFFERAFKPVVRAYKNVELSKMMLKDVGQSEGKGQMPRRSLMHVCLMLCLSSILTPISMSGVLGQSSPTAVSVSPSFMTGDVGQDFSVNVNISGVSDAYGLYGWEFKLGWNASLLDLVSVDEGPFLKSGGNTYFTYFLNTTEEHIVVDCTLEDQIPGVNGSGILATVTFNPTNAGECPLNLYDVTLLNSNEEPINCSLGGSYVTNVILQKTVVFQGYDLDFNVTAGDPSSYPETFNFTAYANNTFIASQTVTLNDGDPTTLSFTWNTAGFALGLYSISTYARLIVGDTDMTNNTFVYGSVYVSMVGDLTGPTPFVPDGKVDGRDITAVAKCFGSNLEDPNYNPNCDILNRGKIDGRDITIVAKNFGQHEP